MKTVISALILVTLFSTVTHGQSTGMFSMRGNGRVCQDIGGRTASILFCPVGYTGFIGRIAFAPLQYVGPIRIAVHALRASDRNIPIIVELVPLKNRPADLGFCDGPGIRVFQVLGNFSCGEVEEIRDPLDMKDFFDIGDQYFVRLHFFASPGEGEGSPPMAWVSVAPSSTVTSVEGKSWGLIKNLYR